MTLNLLGPLSSLPSVLKLPVSIAISSASSTVPDVTTSAALTYTSSDLAIGSSNKVQAIVRQEIYDPHIGGLILELCGFESETRHSPIVRISSIIM
jgi:hypothetical protein